MLLPDELLCHVLEQLPKDVVAVAARTCRRWFACCPAGRRHRLSIDLACGGVALLRWAFAEGCPKDERVCVAAAKQGRLDVLKYARRRMCHWGENTCTAAAEKGHLEVLQWLQEQGVAVGECPQAICSAASGGHLEVLQWLRANGCPWDRSTATEAARHGHLKVLQWVIQNGCPWSHVVCAEAAEQGYLQLLLPAEGNLGEPNDAGGCRCKVWKRADVAEDYAGQVHVLRWLYERGCLWNNRQALVFKMGENRDIESNDERDV